MKIIITRQEAYDNFPEESEILFDKLSKLKMYKKYSEEDIIYAFNYMIKLGHYSTDEEYLSAVAGISLIAYLPNNKGKNHILLSSLPDLFKNKYLKLMQDGREKREKEMQRIASLTEEELNNERLDILEKLTNMGGFYSLRRKR